MAFFPPVPLIRKNLILRKLKACGATSAGQARTLAEAGVINPDGFRRITDRLVQQGIIHKTEDGRYYI